MVKYLFVIAYLCVVMFLSLGHQLAIGETCGDGRHRNARYILPTKRKLTINLFPLMTFRLISLYIGSPLSRILISLYMGSPLSRIYATIYDRVFLDSPDLVKDGEKGNRSHCVVSFSKTLGWFNPGSPAMTVKLLTIETKNGNR